MNKIKQYKIGLFCIVFLTLTFLICPKALASGNYGEDTYGIGNYNTGNNNANSSGGSTGGNTCTASPPSGSPDLFQIDMLKNTATLYFAPSRQPYSSYTISYGFTSDANNYSVNFPYSNATGAIKYIIGGLNANTTYFFKVSSVNVCVGSAWSNTVSAKTTNSLIRKGTYYKNILTFVNNTIQINNNGKSIASLPIPFLPQQVRYPRVNSNKNQTHLTNNSQQNSSSIVAKSSNSTNSSSNWFSNFIRSIKNFFHF